MHISELLTQRRSTRHFDANASIATETLTQLLDTASRAPSSNNAQPWRFMVITEQALREKLLPIAFNQQQVMTASAIIVVLADREAYEVENLTRIHQEEYKEGCFNAEIRDFLIQAAVGFYQPFQETDTLKSIGMDIGLFAMSFMLVAEEAGWQTCPMSGYQPTLLREAFAIPHRYIDLMMIAIGKGIQPGHRTLRRPTTQLIGWNALPE
ncbi:MAG: nitroreductase family protein [Neisseria sp.]|uniref:nitroreductase family protein n=1 Tax=Neisseria sp. TaxID=192066 RepID=UPI0026DB722F|nr:nitroreductase family protein [Neisseria sp.]MDO4641247.1 nitroreductase family protein [Neisseria sp.]